MEAQNLRLKEIGPWSEQYSSSGKRYYYNRETEVSQWEKPTEWKQAEKEHSERAKAQGINKDHEKSTSDKYRPKQTSAQNQTGSTCKQLDPTIPNKMSASNSTKRARLNNSSSPSTQNKKTPTPTTSQQESSSGELFHHHSDSQKQGREKYKSTMSLPTSSVQHQIDDFNKSCHDMIGDQDKSVALIDSSSSRSKHSASYQNLTSPTKNGKLPSPQKSKNCDNGHGIETVAAGFREDKYINFYSPDSGSTIKRGISSEYPNDLKKFAERNLRHSNTLSSIDQDLYSIQILMKTAEFRTQLLTQRIGATSKRIQELESK